MIRLVSYDHLTHHPCHTYLIILTIPPPPCSPRTLLIILDILYCTILTSSGGVCSEGFARLRVAGLGAHPQAAAGAMRLTILTMLTMLTMLAMLTMLTTLTILTIL